ncbi:hypothetical protein BGZ94_004740 [Podila epigama]|nr:hypothetical protein BGZ94_004740 [Podila epigama]
MTNSSVSGSVSSPTSSTSLSTGSVFSPRPISFHWDDYKASEDEQDSDEEHHDVDYNSDYTSDRPHNHCQHPFQYHSFQKDGLHWGHEQDLDHDHDHDHIHHVHKVQQQTTDEDIRSSSKAYHKKFEGHHSVARRRSSSVSSPSSMPSYSSYFADRHIPEEPVYDSFRDGIGASVADVSEELAKARIKMNRASRAMKSMEKELEAMQLGIGTSATARTAIEENFWRLECLALNLEKDRQDTMKQLQPVGRDCSQAITTVTNWQVRIDWLDRRVDNTSEYVSELVLSEQECMSFIKMIIQQNKRYAMPAISRSTERAIRLMAPPKLKEIAPASPTPSMSEPATTQPLPQQPSAPRHINIPISWLLDPLMPPKSPEVLPETTTEQSREKSSTESSRKGKAAMDPRAEVWRDYSRLTQAFESGKTRTPFTPFRRAAGLRSKSAASNGNGEASSSLTGINTAAGSTTAIRRPQIENLTPLPRVLPPPSSTPAVASKLPGARRRSQYLPVHSWLQFQFNKTRTTTGPMGKTVTKDATGFKPITIFQTTI